MSKRGAHTIRRHGFALLTVLWILVGASALTLAAALAGRDGVNAGRNRVQADRAFWRAYGCASTVRAAIDEQFASRSDATERATIWRALDSFVPTSGFAPACVVSLVAAGARLDVNAADSSALDRLFLALGQGAASVSLTDAILDWRDADNVARPRGAERADYLAADLFPPRNDSFADVREVARVRGMAVVHRLELYLGAEPGRIAINSAPREVLHAIPGFSDEVIEHVVRRRAEGKLVTDLLDLGAEVTASSRDAIIEHFPEIVRAATVDPEAWILTVRAESGLPAVATTVELRLVRTGQRAAVMRRRAW